jgi:N,N'-diacetyllegionaminate synthase
MLFAGESALIVAELASSHEGRPELAIRLAQAAAKAGADAVKFQLFRAQELVVAHHPMVEAFRRLELTPPAWAEVVAVARAERLHVLADVYDLPSLELAERLGIEGYKIPTTISGDPILLPRLAATGKPLFLAVSGETEEEIRALLGLLGKRPPGDPVLLHGFQGFPTRLEDTHLRRLVWLGERFGLPVGFADHSPADLPVASVLPVAAVTLGARVIEKHITLDRRAGKSRDHVSSLTPDEFAQMVGWIREVETALGGSHPAYSEAELHYRETMQKKVVARAALPAGALVVSRQLALKRTPDPGIEPARLGKLVGRIVRRALAPDEAVHPEQLADPVAVVLIAVRMKSARLPGKALLPLSGKPVLAHLVERVARARLPRGLVICTSTHPDDQVLLEWAARLGVPAYAGSEDDVLDRFLKATDREGADLVVRVTGDNPLTDPAAIDAMIQLHCREGADYTYTDDLPRGTRPEVISVSALRRAHELAEDPLGSEYMTLYFKEHPEVFTLVRWEAPETVRRPHYRLTLDTPEDLELLRLMNEALYREGEIFSLVEAVRLLDSHSEWAAINAHIEPRIPPGINTRLRSHR